MSKNNKGKQVYLEVHYEDINFFYRFQILTMHNELVNLLSQAMVMIE
jgi:hypothetical protein